MDNGVDVKLPEEGAAEAVSRLSGAATRLQDSRPRRAGHRPSPARPRGDAPWRGSRHGSRRDAQGTAKTSQGESHVSHRRPSLTPRLKPLSPRKSAVLSVLDVGTSKVVCLVARLDPVSEVGFAAGPHASRPHHRHRPPALARAEGRRDRRPRGRRAGDPPRRRRGRAHGQGRNPGGDRQHDRRPARLADLPRRRRRSAAMR